MKCLVSIFSISRVWLDVEVCLTGYYSGIITLKLMQIGV